MAKKRTPARFSVGADGIPRIEVSLIDGYSVRQFAFWCPFCGRQHFHGAGRLTDDWRRFLGHRVAHCPDRTPDNAGGYFLVVKEDTSDEHTKNKGPLR